MIPTGIENRESSQESRLATDCQLTFEWYCISNSLCVYFSLKVYDNFDVWLWHLLYGNPSHGIAEQMIPAKCKSLFWLLNGDQAKGDFPP